MAASLARVQAGVFALPRANDAGVVPRYTPALYHALARMPAPAVAQRANTALPLIMHPGCCQQVVTLVVVGSFHDFHDLLNHAVRLFSVQIRGFRLDNVGERARRATLREGH